MIKSIPAVFLICIFSLLSPLKAEDSNEKISFNMAIGYAHPAHNRNYLLIFGRAG